MKKHFNTARFLPTVFAAVAFAAAGTAPALAQSSNPYGTGIFAYAPTTSTHSAADARTAAAIRAAEASGQMFMYVPNATGSVAAPLTIAPAMRHGLPDTGSASNTEERGLGYYTGRE
jgi:hypothetical protein